MLATIAIMTTGAMSTAYADKGGDPNNAKPAQLNAEEREDKKAEKREANEAAGKNTNGGATAHKNMFDGHGVEPVDDDD
jgi:hypothetical protein